MDRVHICYYLLNKGADASQRDNDNKTPLDYALIKQHEFVVALFTCHDASVGDFIKMQRYIVHIHVNVHVYVHVHVLYMYMCNCTCVNNTVYC